MDNIKFAVFTGNVNGFHHPATFLSPVARINIDVPAPETFRTMIGVAVAFDFCSTIFANEIFYCPLKFFHRFIVVRGEGPEPYRFSTRVWIFSFASL